MTTAVATNELALTYVRSTELRQQLIADEITLRQMATQRTAPQPTQQKSPNQSGVGCLVLLGIAGLFALIGSFNSNKSVPTPSYPAPASPSPTDYGNNSVPPPVPRPRTWELDRDRQAAEDAKAQLTQLYTQIESLSKEIEQDRAYLNRSSQVAVDEFNRKVNRYNSMLEEAKSRERAVNQMVDDYNTKLRLNGQ